jgi:hypothetical protein
MSRGWFSFLGLTVAIGLNSRSGRFSGDIVKVSGKEPVPNESAWFVSLKDIYRTTLPFPMEGVVLVISF